MKTTFLNMARLTGIALLAFVMVQCDDKGNIEPNKPTQFDLPTITAEFPDIVGTETTKALISADGIVKCSEEDQLKVFVETQGEEVADWEDVTHKYLTNASDCKLGLFKPEVPLVLPNLDAKINMYAMSPWSDLVTDPIGGEESYSEFSFDGQIQDYNDITAHLSNYALMTGVVENVVAGQNPQIKMEHKTALLKFTIENQLRKDLQLQAVKIIAPEGVNISGSYKINFKAGEPLVPVSPKNEATLTIRNAKTIQADDNIDIFIMTPEFALTAGQTIQLDVTSTVGVWSKLITIPENVNIQAGKLNTTVVERDKHSVEMLWSKTHEGLNLKSVNALGVAINDQYMFIQEYDGRCHLYNRNTGAYLKEVVQGGPYSFMLNADVDDAGHFISSRHNVYGAGFIVFRYDVENDKQVELLNFTKDAGCPEDMGFGLGVSGDVTKGDAIIYGTAPGAPKVYCWMLKDGQLVTPADSPIIMEVPNVDSWVIANVDQLSADPNADRYVAYLQEGASEAEGGSKFQIYDKDNTLLATMDPANHYYRILDFKVFKMGNRTLLATTEQGYERWDAVRMQIFDISNKDNLKLKPGDAGYEKFWLYSSPVVGVTDYNRWANASVYVDEANNEAYITSGAVGNADAPTNVRLFKLSLYE